MAAFTGMSLSYAMFTVFAFGTFVKPLEEEFGWQRGEMSFALTMTNIAVVIASPTLGIHRRPAGGSPGADPLDHPDGPCRCFHDVPYRQYLALLRHVSAHPDCGRRHSAAELFPGNHRLVRPPPRHCPGDFPGRLRCRRRTGPGFRPVHDRAPRLAHGLPGFRCGDFAHSAANGLFPAQGNSPREMGLCPDGDAPDQAVDKGGTSPPFTLPHPGLSGKRGGRHPELLVDPDFVSAGGCWHHQHSRAPGSHAYRPWCRSPAWPHSRCRPWGWA